MSEFGTAPALATERPAAGVFTATQGEAGDPHHSEHDGRNPQQVNGKSCTEKNEYQESQQDYDHDRSSFCPRCPGWARVSETTLTDGRLDLNMSRANERRHLFPEGVLHLFSGLLQVARGLISCALGLESPVVRGPPDRVLEMPFCCLRLVLDLVDR